jgi:hypothetical protein
MKITTEKIPTSLNVKKIFRNLYKVRKYRCQMFRLNFFEKGSYSQGLSMYFLKPMVYILSLFPIQILVTKDRKKAITWTPSNFKEYILACLGWRCPNYWEMDQQT